MIFNALVHCTGITNVVEGRAYGYNEKRRAQGVSHDAKMLPGLQEKKFLPLHLWLNLLTCIIINLCV